MEQQSIDQGTEKGESLEHPFTNSLIPLICVFFLLLSCIMSIIAANWNGIHSALSELWKASASQDPVLDKLSGYTDVFVALIVSILVALLSITITMYVFLKNAMDRIVDENPYITSVARAY